MLFGQDFPKIEVEFYGLKLLEPNSFLGDMVLFVACWFFAKKAFSLGNDPFYKCWGWFFFSFSVATFFGGFGHLLYEFTGTIGKFPSWYLGFVATFFIEQAMISVHSNSARKTLFKRVSIIKLIIVVLGTTIVYSFFTIPHDLRIGMHINTLNSFIGFSFSLFYLSLIYVKTNGRYFYYFLLSYSTLLLAALFQVLKINIHQWFDRNDVGHLLLCFSFILYYLGIKGYKSQQLSNN